MAKKSYFIIQFEGSEWLLPTQQFFSYIVHVYDDENMLIFNDMMMMSTLY